MEMEIEFFHKTSTEKNPRSLMDHIQKMNSGEAPFFPATLGLVYDKLFGDPLPQPIAPSSGLGKSVDTGNQGVAERATAARTPDPTSRVALPHTPGNPLHKRTSISSPPVSRRVWR